MKTGVVLPEIELGRVGIRVMEKNPDWSDERLDEAITEYRRFLTLCKAHSGQKIGAPPDVDEVWHIHILDTKRYAQDCNRYFGYFLHHDPCIGSPDFANALDTIRLYRSTFDIEPPMLWHDMMTCANPGKGCGSLPATYTV